MSTLTIHYAVYSLDNRILLPAGTILSPSIMNSLISSSRATYYRACSPLEYGSVKKDLLYFMSQPPYHVIFADKKQIDDVLSLMDSVQIGIPVLQPLDYFKQYDVYTYRHILMVSALSTLLANDLVPGRYDLIQGSAAGPTHDIGKVCVPLQILKKSDPLTRPERGILSHHAAAGYVLLSYYLKDDKGLASRTARDHHERRDGSGYPRGTRLIDPMVEITAVSDVYDALISPRPYRPVSYDNRTALEEITSMAERNEISWNVVKALVSHNRKAKPHYSECEVSAERRGTPPEGNVYGITAEEENNTH